MNSTNESVGDLSHPEEFLEIRPKGTHSDTTQSPCDQTVIHTRCFAKRTCCEDLFLAQKIEVGVTARAHIDDCRKVA